MEHLPPHFPGYHFSDGLHTEPVSEHDTEQNQLAELHHNSRSAYVIVEKFRNGASLREIEDEISSFNRANELEPQPEGKCTEFTLASGLHEKLRVQIYPKTGRIILSPEANQEIRQAA